MYVLCIHWIYQIVYILWKIVYVEYIKLCTFFWKIVYVEFTKLSTFFDGLDIECIDFTLSVICEDKCPHVKKLCTLNIQTWAFDNFLRCVYLEYMVEITHPIWHNGCYFCFSISLLILSSIPYFSLFSPIFLQIQHHAFFLHNSAV